VWDVSHFFCTASQQLGLSYVTFLCPASQVDPSAAQAAFNNYNSFNIIQYNIWIPRLNGSDIIPPAPNYVGIRFVIVQPAPAPFAGPANAFDSSMAGNPIITDILATNQAITPAANADASVAGDPYQISGNSNHLNGKQLVGVNAGYVDGHVEFHQGNEVHPYYRGNWWNWR
jgi:prepilin-type processing-associated H-X9-DG protein